MSVIIIKKQEVNINKLKGNDLMEYYSQFLQDKFLNENLFDNKENGFFRYWGS
jgi:hypothetical protein